MSRVAQRTAFVFAGGGSLGAVQVGMLRELMHAGVNADLVLGSSVGAMNAAYFAGAPNAAGVDKLEKVWRGLRRHDVFPVTIRSVLGFMGGADNLIDPSNLRNAHRAQYSVCKSRGCTDPRACCCHESWWRHRVSVVGPYG